MDKKQTDILSIFALITSLILAIITPSIPQFSLNKLISFQIQMPILIILIIALLVLFSKAILDRIREIEEKIEKLDKQTEKINNNITFIEKTLEKIQDTADIKAKVNAIEKKVFGK